MEGEGVETHATLVLSGGGERPSVVTERLGLSPTRMRVQGQRAEWREGVLQEARPTTKRRPWTTNSWHLTTLDALDSRDSLRHVEWLLSRIEDKAPALRRLQADGWEAKVWVFWASGSNVGGPHLTSVVMGRLAKLGISVAYEFHFVRSE